ncbi:MAG: DUF805 domain-containing protein [Pseudomonadota bacterium]
MPPSVAIKIGLRKYATFTGCASRAEFWWFALFLAIVTTLLLVPAILADDAMINAGSRIAGDYHPLIWLVLICSAVPLHASASRRLNDIGWPGALVFLPVLVFAFAFVGAGIISGSPSSPNYNGYASWGFVMLMFCLLLISVGGLLAALLMPTRSSTITHEVTQ